MPSLPLLYTSRLLGDPFLVMFHALCVHSSACCCCCCLPLSSQHRRGAFSRSARSNSCLPHTRGTNHLFHHSTTRTSHVEEIIQKSMHTSMYAHRHDLVVVLPIAATSPVEQTTSLSSSSKALVSSTSSSGIKIPVSITRRCRRGSNRQKARQCLPPCLSSTI